MFEFQKGLPRLPVPPLHQTLEKYLFYVKGLVTADQYARTKSIVENFASSPAANVLHGKLVAMSQHPAIENWLDRWWSDAYLKDRSSPGCYISPAVSLTDHPNPQVQADRAMRATLLIKYSIEFKGKIDRRALEVDRVRGQPLCMADYTRLFSSVRVPLLGRDRIETHSNTQHIIVLKRGHVFAVDILDDHGALLPLHRIYAAIKVVESKADDLPSQGSIGALTALHRDEWAKARGHIIASSAANDFSVLLCESAIFVLTLDDGEPRLDTTDVLWSSMFGVPPNRLRGAAPPYCNRYWDKSLQIHLAQNGRAGLTFEHSGMDSLPPLMWTKFVTSRQQEEGHDAVSLVLQGGDGSDAEPAKTRLVHFPVPDEAIDRYLAAGMKAFQETMDALDMEAVVVSDWGAKDLKALKCSPDAFAQMAFQVTFKQLFGYVPSTYESAATKAFALGRTETLRTVTEASNSFVEAFLRRDGSPTSNKAIGEALQKASAIHTATSKACAAGQGCDRHLYGMLCAAKELNLAPMPELFTDPTFAHYMKIELSSSHPFAVTGSRHVCFGPVSAKCVGIAYFLLENELLFGITAWQPGKAKEFARALVSNMIEMKKVIANYNSHRPASKL